MKAAANLKLDTNRATNHYKPSYKPSYKPFPRNRLGRGYKPAYKPSRSTKKLFQFNLNSLTQLDGFYAGL